jgi:hypothetical protein
MYHTKKKLAFNEEGHYGFCIAITRVFPITLYRCPIELWGIYHGRP